MTRQVRSAPFDDRRRSFLTIFLQLYLTKPDYDEALLERILWEDRERVNSEEAYRRIYQSNSGSLVSDILRRSKNTS